LRAPNEGRGGAISNIYIKVKFRDRFVVPDILSGLLAMTIFVFVNSLTGVFSGPRLQLANTHAIRALNVKYYEENYDILHEMGNYAGKNRSASYIETGEKHSINECYDNSHDSLI
jgi:hypothetical protein